MIVAVSGGHIPPAETHINAIAQWANDCERKLLGLHCGQMLDRARHRAWAARKLSVAVITPIRKNVWRIAL